MTDPRKLIQIVEIDVPYCANTYGQSPCTATGSAGEECYNCFSTCQDTENFVEETKTLRFTNADTGIPKGQTLFPVMEGGVSTNPTTVNAGDQNDKEGALGRRATVNFTLRDFPYHDRLLDKYVSTRPYVPEETGTFWRKWKARWPYYKGFPVRVLDGEQDQALSNMRTRYYVLDTVDGPADSKTVKIKAKDVLALADNKRALAPALTDARLAQDISSSTAVAVLEPSGITSEIPSSGKAKIGSEAVEYAVSLPGIVTLTRGIDGTDASNHEAGDNFQPAYSVDGVRIDNVIQDLVENYAGVDPSFWDPNNADEAETWMSSFVLTADIYEPTGVNELLGEITRVGTLIWWDEVEQLIKIRAIRPGVGDEIKSINDTDNILAGSISLTDHPDEQISQIWTYYDQISPFEDVDDGQNYNRINVRRSEETEEASGESVIKRQYSRWLTSENEGAIIANSLRVLNRFIDIPIRGKLELDVADRDTIWTGDVLRVDTDVLTDASGQSQERLFQVISAEDVDPGHRVRYKIQSMEPPGKVISRPFYVVANSTPTYENATDAQKSPKGGFIVDETTLEFADGTEPYQII